MEDTCVNYDFYPETTLSRVLMKSIERYVQSANR